MSEDGQKDAGDELMAGLSEIADLTAAGDYPEAQSVCQRLLRDHPTSAALHEQMGDLLYARELWDDAAEWYDLADQLGDSLDLKQKMHDAQRHDRAARMGGPDDDDEEQRAASRRNTHLMMLGVAAALVTVVAVVLVIGWLRSRGGEAPPTTLAGSQMTTRDGISGGLRSLSGTAPPRGIVASPRAPGSGVSRPYAHAQPGGDWSASLPSARAPRRNPTTTQIETMVEPITDHDRMVINAVSSLTWGDSRPLTGRVSAMVDEYQGYAVVRVTIPPSVSRAGLAEDIVRMAFRVARATVMADEAINAVTVQIVRGVSTGRGSASMEIMWRGNASRRRLEEYSRSGDDVGTLLTQVFAAVRWNPALTAIGPEEYTDDGMPSP